MEYKTYKEESYFDIEINRLRSHSPTSGTYKVFNKYL